MSQVGDMQLYSRSTDIIHSLFFGYIVYTTLAICRHRNVCKISLLLAQFYNSHINVEHTDFLGIRQVQVIHDLDKLIQTLGQPWIVTFLLPHTALQLTSVIISNYATLYIFLFLSLSPSLSYL